jgi:hypothetical protein
MIAMKRYFMLVALGGLLFSGCTSTGSLSGTDDVYANPAEERALAQKQREEQIKKEQAEREAAAMSARQREEQAEKEKNNPYYKDPVYTADDYYDYEYASRINRFSTPIPGAGYYDPYYTNMYSYNQNPAYYGTSIYSNWGMPSSQFNYYSMGVSSGWGYSPGLSMGMGYGNFYNGYSMYSPYYSPYYNPYGYNAAYYDPWGYNSYYSGYNAGYYNGMNNAYWGYYNAYDPNSNYKQVHVGPRGSGAGNNSNPRESSTRATESMTGRRRYIESVAAEQNNAPRFTESQRASGSRAQQGNANTQGTTIQETGRSSQSQSSETRTDRRARSGRAYEAAPQQQNNDPRGQEQQRTQSPEKTWNPAPVNSGGGRSSSGGGNSSPRNSSGGNSHRSR